LIRSAFWIWLARGISHINTPIYVMLQALLCAHPLLLRYLTVRSK
jgi:hypothetical protein